MRKFILGALASVALITSAQADGWGPRRHGMGGYPGVPPHHYHSNGGDAGVALFGGLVGGLIIGGMINNMNQPRYQTYYQDYEPMCREVIVNRFWNGWRWVYRTATVCE